MKKYIWLIILVLIIWFRSTEANSGFAVGIVFGQFLIGLTSALIWWLFTRNNLSSNWLWFNWLNFAAYVVAIIFMMHLAIPGWAHRQNSGNPQIQVQKNEQDLSKTKSKFIASCEDGYVYNGKNCEPDWSTVKVETTPAIIDRSSFGGCKSGYVNHPTNPDKCVLPAVAERYYRNRN